MRLNLDWEKYIMMFENKGLLKKLFCLLAAFLIVNSATAFANEQASQVEKVKGNEETTQNQINKLMPDHPSIDKDQKSNAASSSEGYSDTGIVEETFNSGSYTYVSVKANDELVWLAGPQVGLEKGNQISWKNAFLMSNFTSQSLNKTFEKIYFVGSFIQATPQNFDETGTIEQKINAGTYVYLAVKVAKKLKWIALPEANAQVEIGNTIGWSKGVPMKDFTSKTLDRKFEEVIFINRVFVTEEK